VVFPLPIDLIQPMLQKSDSGQKKLGA
jgi:hypothetical protein